SSTAVSGCLRRTGRPGLHAEVLEHERCEIDDAARLALDADREQRHLGIAGAERAVAAAAEVMAPTEIDELEAGSRRDEEIAGIRVRERRERALKTVGVVEDRRVARGRPAVVRRREAELLALAPCHGLLA